MSRSSARVSSGSRSRASSPRRGARVAVFERTGIGAGASGVQPGGIRQQWGTEVACRLASESATFYAEADEHLRSRVPLGFRALRLPLSRAQRGDAARGSRKTSASRTNSACRRGSSPPRTLRSSSRDWCRTASRAGRGAPRTATSTGRRASSKRSRAGLDIRIGEVASLDARSGGHGRRRGRGGHAAARPRI